MPVIVAYEAEITEQQEVEVFTEYGQQLFNVDRYGNPIEEAEEEEPGEEEGDGE